MLVDGLMPEEPAFAPGQRRGRYLLLSELGRGGMGAVLRAYDPKLQREVAVKVLRRRHFDETAAARLVREAQAMAQLSHPNVVAVYDVDQDADGVSLAMELVQGQTLQQWCQQPHPWRDTLRVLVGAGRGLAAAHACGLVHRDFKPANVLIGEDGRPRVTDFGLAREHGGSRSRSGGLPEDFGTDSSMTGTTDLTEAGKVMGTPPYMAPEQHVGGEFDHRGDQYAFCITSWQALTGERPFDVKAGKLLAQKRRGPPKWPSTAGGIPGAVVDAIRRGLAFDPRARWPDMTTLLDALEGSLRRKRRAFAAIGTVVAIGVGLAAGRLGAATDEVPCRDGDERMRRTWSDHERTTVREAMTATGVGYAEDAAVAAIARLDDYAEQWRGAFADACEATTVRREQSQEMMDRRMACLDDHRRALASTVEVLTDADAKVVERAGQIVAALPDVGACADLDGLLSVLPPPTDPATRTEVGELRDTIARAEALRLAGKYDDAERDADDAVRATSDLDYPAVRAEALLLRGRVRNDVNDVQGSFEDLRAAYELGLEIGHDEVASYAATNLAFVVGTKQEKNAEGEQWGRTALALARRYEPRGRAEAFAHNNLCGVFLASGDLDRAKLECEECLRLREQIFNPDHPDIAGVVTNLGNVANVRGEYEEAVKLQRRALAIRQHAHGRTHPLVALAAHNLAAALFQLGELDEAVQVEQRAYEIWSDAHGADSHYAATAMNNLGAISAQRGKHEEAAEYYRNALAIWDKAGSEGLANASNARTNLALSLAELGRIDEAEKLHLVVLQERDKADAMHPNLASTLVNLAEVNLTKGDRTRARAFLTRAHEVAKDLPKVHHIHESLADLDARMGPADAADSATPESE